MGLELGTAALVTGILGAGASVAGTVASSKANKKATETASASADKALDYERESEVRRREEFDRTEAENRRQYEENRQEENRRFGLSREDALRREGQETRMYDDRQRHFQPYRETGYAALADLGARAGLTIRPAAPPTELSSGWSPDELSPPQNGGGRTLAAVGRGGR